MSGRSRESVNYMRYMNSSFDEGYITYNTPTKSSSQSTEGEYVNNTPPVHNHVVQQPHGNNINYYACPICGQMAISTCECVYRDSRCANGHYWYSDKGAKLVGNSPGHSSN